MPEQQWSELFFEVFAALPRQGPGNRASAVRALGLCRDLPPSPRVLDLGCGTGGQTLHLAALTAGRIVAIDNHAPGVRRLRATVAQAGLGQRVLPLVGDMARLGLAPAGFDLIWSEGALYNLGIAKALEVCRALLRPGGYLAFTEAVWRKPHPPPAVRAAFADYPGMGGVGDVVAAIERSGLSLEGHFTLPDAAWWDDFYTPMLRRIAELRDRHAHEREALAVLDGIAAEPELHRRHAAYYAYAFFVARRT